MLKKISILSLAMLYLLITTGFAVHRCGMTEAENIAVYQIAGNSCCSPVSDDSCCDSTETIPLNCCGGEHESDDHCCSTEHKSFNADQEQNYLASSLSGYYSAFFSLLYTFVSYDFSSLSSSISEESSIFASPPSLGKVASIYHFCQLRL